MNLSVTNTTTSLFLDVNKPLGSVYIARQRQRRNDSSETALNEKNGVAPKWVVAVLTLTLNINGP